MSKPKSCNKPCSPSDWHKGGKCDLNGCMDEPVEKEDVLTHDFYVMKDYDGKFQVWTKKEYEEYIIGAVIVGGGSAFKIIMGFNGDENYLFPSHPSPKKEEGGLWVSVEDRLPEEGKRILIYYKNSYGKHWRDIAFYTKGGVKEFDDDDDNWPECYSEKDQCSYLPEGFWIDAEDEEKCFQRHNVTHWMPLPNPPNSP